VLIQCSRCRAVFSLQDGVAPAGSRFKVQCGRCREIFEAIAAPKSVPAPPVRDPLAAAAPAIDKGEPGGEIVAASAQEWTPEPAEAVVRQSAPALALAPDPLSGEVAPAPAGSRRRFFAFAGAVAAAIVAIAIVRACGHGATVEEMLRQGRELLLRDDGRSLEKATRLFTDAARAAPGQAVPEGERAFALLLQAGAAKDLARRVPAAERDKQQKQAEKLLQQGAAAARQALSDDKDEAVALRAAALADALEEKSGSEHLSRLGADPWGLYVKGAAASAAGQRDAAVQALSAARAAEPRMVRVNVDLAALSLDGGDPAGARALLTEALRANPEHDRAKRMLSLLAP